jgi:hypothetical protein
MSGLFVVCFVGSSSVLSQDQECSKLNPDRGGIEQATVEYPASTSFVNQFGNSDSSYDGYVRNAPPVQVDEACTKNHKRSRSFPSIEVLVHPLSKPGAHSCHSIVYEPEPILTNVTGMIVFAATPKYFSFCLLALLEFLPSSHRSALACATRLARM